MRKHLLYIMAACLLVPHAAWAAGPIEGNWVNPHGSVVVTTGPCRDQLCGWISWANDKARADAEESGLHTLIGTELLQDYHVAGAGKWTGRVYVPDMGKTYYSTIEQIDANRLKISGCLLGGWLCKSQLWQRRS
ncbi:MAG: DUF2147 domain-containing protein [bacterium]|nr:DUF2147 domain-containing protein [bacterium]